MEGNYAVTGTLLNGTGQTLATGGDTFNVLGDLSVALSGTVTVASRTVPAGAALLCTRTTRNGGTTDLTNLSLRHVVARLADGATVNEQVVSAAIAAGGSQSAVSSIDTAGFAGGDYACALQARVNDSWRDLGYAVFSVTAPTVRIDATLALGKRGKLLALVDGSDGWPCTQMKDIELWAPFPTPLTPNAQVLVELFNSSGTRLDRETIKLSNYRGTVNANRVNGSDVRITGLSADVLTVQLASNAALGSGWQLVATVTMDGLPPIILESSEMGESCGWRVGIGAELGDFEVVDGTGIGCNQLPARVASVPSLPAQRAFLEQQLTEAGWSYKIVTSAADFKREMRSGVYAHYALFSEQEKLGEQVQHELREAVFAGATLLDAGSHDHRHHSFDEALGIKPNGKRPNATAVTFTAPWMTPGTASIVRTQFPLRITLDGAQSIGQYNVSQSQGPVAITEYTYGRGATAYVGYDLLAEATNAGAASLHTTFLRKVLDELVAQRPVPRAGEVVPLELTITNRAGASPGRATLTLPAGVELIDAGGADVQSGTLAWDFSLAVDEVLKRTALVRLPQAPGAVNFAAVVSSGIAPNLVEQARPALTVNVTARASSQDALALANAYPNTFRNVAQWLQQAASFAAAVKPGHALSSQVKATDELLCISHPQASNLRWMIDDLIWNTSRLVP
jgi:hypothetical protein